jgi:Mrp family chromosome partitioning ATPase
VLAALTSLLLGAIAVWIRSRIDPVVRTADRAAAAAGLPVLGSVTSAPVGTVDELEGYRRLRTRLRSMISRTGEVDDRGRVWVLASAAGEVDTATVASNLGRAMELAGSRSVVLDTGMPVATKPRQDSAKDNNRNDDEPVRDNDQPANNGNHKADNETESNAGPEHASAEPSIRRGADGFPDTLSVGAWAHDPDLAAAKAAAGLFGRLRNEYAHVIVATPPVLTTITASVVSEYADAVLLVLSMDMTRRGDLGHAADTLRATGAPLTGAVLSDASGIVHSDNGGKRFDTVAKVHALASDVRGQATRSPGDGRRDLM